MDRSRRRTGNNMDRRTGHNMDRRTGHNMDRLWEQARWRTGSITVAEDPGRHHGMARDCGPPGDITWAGPRLTEIDGMSTRMESMFWRFKLQGFDGLETMLEPGRRGRPAAGP